MVLRIPGFVVKDGKSGPYLTLRGQAGLIVPCRDRAGRIVALKVRRDDVGEGQSATATYLRRDTAAPAPVCRSCSGWNARGDRVGAPHRGRAKGRCCAGPDRFADRLRAWREQLAAGHGRAAGAGLQDGPHRVRLRCLGQADREPRPRRSSAEALAAAGMAVELERWAAADGKGLHDLLAAGMLPEVVTGDEAAAAIRDALDTATAGDEPATPDELARLRNATPTSTLKKTK